MSARDGGLPMSLPAHLGYLALALLAGEESLGLLIPGETVLAAWRSRRHVT